MVISVLVLSLFAMSYAPTTFATSNITTMAWPTYLVSSPTGSITTPVLPHPATATYYAQISTDDNGNYSVTSSLKGTASGCVNTSVSPCFTIQLTTYNSNGAAYQWVYEVDYGQDVVACVTTNTGCSSSNSHTFTSFPTSEWFHYVFQINFNSATSVTFLMQDVNGSQSWSPSSSANLNNLVSWEVSVGVGDGGGSCAIWQSGVTWYVSGYAPSGTNMTNLSTTPHTCTASSGSTYNGGSAVWWAGNTFDATGEASNLEQFSWTSNSATNFGYQLSV